MPLRSSNHSRKLTVMLKLFSRYFTVGILNTAIHWIVFSTILFNTDAGQSLANFGAFCFAVTFSFFANAKWTFSTEATTLRYLIYIVFMGSVASCVGWAADQSDLPPLVTLVVFSSISLVCGFLYSKFIVFREIK